MPNNKKLAQQRAMVKVLSSQKKRETESKAKGKQASTYALPSENKPFTLLEKAAIRRSQQNRPQGSSVNYAAEFDNIQQQMKDLRLKQLGSFVTGLRANPLMTYQTNTDEINAYADEISRLKQRSAVLKANEQADIVRNAQQKYRDSGSKVNTAKLNRSFVDRGIEGSPLEAKGNRFFEGEPLEWLADLDASDFKDPDLYIDALRTTQLIGKGDHGQTLATAIATSLQPEYERYMSDEEIGTYNYLWENESRKAAREYLSSLKPELNARRTEQSNAKWSEYAGRNAGTAAAASAASVPLNLLGGPASTGEMLKQNAIGALTGKYGVDYNQTGGMMAQNAEAIRGAVTQKYNWNLGNWDAFDTLYGSGMSLLDSLAASAVGGNAGKASEVIGGLVLGSSAASGAARDIVSRGGTDDQALAGAVAAGAFETLFEKVSIGNFKALQEVAPNTFKDVAKNVLKSVGVNASEEAATELANIIYDTVALGDISNWELSVQNYMEQGLSEEQAKAQTAHDMALQIGEAGLSGALIGGGMAGAGSAIGWLNNRQAANVGISEFESAALNTLADISERQTAGTSTIADEVAEKVLTGQAPTNSEIRQLYAASGPVRAQFAELTGIDIVGMDQTKLRAALSAAAKSPAITEERIAELEELSLMEQAQSSLDNPSAVDAYFDAAMNAPAASRAAMNDAASAIMDPNAEQNAPDLAQSFREDRTAAKTSANTVTVGKGADFSGLDISNKRKSQLSAASAVLGKLGVQSDIDVKGDILTQTGTQVYAHIKNSPAAGKALSEYFGGQWNEFSSQEKADHAARFIGEAVRKEAVGEMLNSSEKAVMKAVGDIGRGAQTVKSEQEDDINSPKNRLAGAKVDLNYAQMKAKEYGNARYGGTKETRDRFEMWNDEVKRLQKEVAQLEEQVGESVNEDDAESLAEEYTKIAKRQEGDQHYEQHEKEYAEEEREKKKKAAQTASATRSWKNFVKKKEAQPNDGFYGLSASEMKKLIEIYEAAVESENATVIDDIEDYLTEINYDSTIDMLEDGDYEGIMEEYAEEEREDDAAPKFMARKSEIDGNAESEYAEYDKPITSEDIEILRSIGRKSINDFSAEDTKKSQKWAHKFWQQLGTKSPFFRAWFGDWRAYDKTSINVIDDVERADLSDAKDAPAVLKQMKSSDDIPSGDFVNNDTGFTIQVGQKVINDTLAYASRSYNRDKNFMHFLDRISALRGIDKIIENAVLLDTQVIGEDKNADRSFMHIFYTVMKYEDNAYIIRLSVDEFNSRRGDIYRAYNLKNIKITPVAVPQVYKPADTTSASGTLSSINSISDLFTLVKKYDPGFNPHEVNPALLNEDGTPKVLYHQTENDFTQFDVMRKGAGSSDPETPFGVFLKESDRDIGLKGKKQMGLYATMKKPLIVENREQLVYEVIKISPEYETLYAKSKEIDREYSKRHKEAVEQFKEFVIKNSQSPNRKSRQELYSDPEFIRLFEAEDNIVDEWEETNRANDAKAKQALTNALRENDFDGVILKHDVGSFGRSTEAYIVLDNTQVKSATDNIGTFDKENSDIRFAARGKAKAKVNPRTENAKSGNVELATNIGTLNVPTVDPLIFTHGDSELTSSYRKVERMAKSFNKEPVWIAGSSVTLDGKEYGIDGGFYYKGKLYLNIENMTEGYTMLFGHELCHDMVEKDRRNNGGKSTLLSDYYNLRRAWAEKNGTTDAFEARVNDIINNRVFDDTDPDAVFEEFMCDDLGTFMMNEDFARFAVAEKRSLWQKITYAVGNFVKRLKGIGARNEARELEQLHAFMLSALDNYRTDPQRNAAAAPRSVADRLSGINEPTAVAPSTLTRGIRRDARLAEQVIKDSQGRYKPREYRNISPAKWQGSTSESDRALAGVTTRNASEVDSYGYRKVSDGQSEYRVYVTNPNSPKLNKQHKDNIKAVRAFAAATGTRVGFTTGKAIMTAKEGNEYLYKYDAINDNGTVYVNLDAADPYTAIVGAHWYNQYAAANPARARTLARLVKRMNKLTGGNATAQDVAVKQITDSEQSSNAPMSRAQMSAEALKMTSADLLATLSGDKTLARSIAKEQPTLIRRALDVTGDMLSRLTGTAEERAKKLMQQTEANLLYALSSSAENNTTPEGSKISTAKKKPLPSGMRAMYAGESAATADKLRLADAQQMLADGAGAESVRQQTGWFKGMDGKWRFEIDDSKAVFNRKGFGNIPPERLEHIELTARKLAPEGFAKPLTAEENKKWRSRWKQGTAARVKLEEVFNHPELFRSYPELKGINVYFEYMGKHKHGSYDAELGRISLNIEKSETELKDTLIHELQHVVQSIEGFASGANPAYWDEMKSNGFDSRTAEDRRKALRLEQKIEQIRSEKPEFYADMMELEKISPTVPRGAVDWNTLEQIEEDPPEWKRYDAARERLEQKYDELEVWDFIDLQYRIAEANKKAGRTAVQLYYDTAGEIEARDSEKRRDYTAEQRRATPPDLGDDDTVFVEDNVSSMSIDNDVKFSALRNPTRQENRAPSDPVDTYKRRDLRSKISKEVKALSAALVTPSDKKHIPEKLTGAMADFLKEFTNDTSVFTASKLALLKNAYDRISDSGADAESDISFAYDPDISAYIAELSETIDGRRLAQLDIEETTRIYQIVQHFKHLVNTESKILLEGRRREVAGLGQEIMREANRQKSAKENNEKLGVINNFTDMLTNGNITPAYFFKRIGGTFEKLFKALRNGQNVWAHRMIDARKAYENAFNKYHAREWLNKKNDILKFTTVRGDDITLTREQALTLYATNKREATNNIQEAGHLRLGGFVYEDATAKKHGKVDTTKAHPLAVEDIARIVEWLTPEQMSFADEMVGYLSGDLAKLGNETSMKLHGWEKFTEDYYFPYNSAENYLYTKQAVSEDRRLKHMSFTKATVRKANNPIVLSDFTKVWADHVQRMMMYSSLAAPLEDFNRVFNYKTSVTEDDTSRSVKESIEKAYGKKANRYINQFLADINGGVRTNFGDSTLTKMLSKFKKSAVFASASVVIQQPSAIGRAMALIHPKYFVAKTFSRRSWEECKKYCGAAVIKEMGGFDTNTGRGAADWLIAQPYAKTEQKAAAFFTDSKYRDDVLSAPAAKADAMTWSEIWNAVKRECVVEKKLKPNSEELFKAAAERFDEVVNFTQVYDSVFARSELMRAKSFGMQALTNFMSEPTVSYNMLYDSFVNAKRNDISNKVSPARAISAFLLTVTLNTILKSLVTAAREKDEDKTYLEKYFGELVENGVNDANPLNLIPYVRDIMSLIEGYNVDNPAYEVPSMVIDAVDDLFNNDSMTLRQKLGGIADAVSALFGIPLKNIRRDIDSITNTFFKTKPLEQTSKSGILDSVLDKLPFYQNTNSANYQRLYIALRDGDTEAADKFRERLAVNNADESDVLRGLRSVVKSEYLDDALSEETATDFLVDYGGKTEDEAYWTLQEWSYKEEHPDEKDSFSKYDDFREALKSGTATEIEETRSILLEHGVLESSVNSEMNKALREGYLFGEVTETEAISYMTEYGGKTEDEAYWKVIEWSWEEEHPDDESFSKYDRMRTAVEGDDRREMREAMIELLEHGVKFSTLKSEVKKVYGTSSLVYQLGLGKYDEESEQKGGGRSGGGRKKSKKLQSVETSSSLAKSERLSSDSSSNMSVSDESNSIKRGATVRMSSGAASKRSSAATDAPPAVSSQSLQTSVYANCRFNTGGKCNLGRSSCSGCNNNKG